jgi:hypothetical protein
MLFADQPVQRGANLDGAGRGSFAIRCRDLALRESRHVCGFMEKEVHESRICDFTASTYSYIPIPSHSLHSLSRINPFPATQARLKPILAKPVRPGKPIKPTAIRTPFAG